MKFWIFTLLAAASFLSSNAAFANVTKEDASKLALEEIRHYPEKCVLLPELTREEDFGWVFFCTTEKYNKTRNPGDLVPGMGPIAIEKNGRLTHITTSVEPARAIQIFSDALKSGDPKLKARLHIGESLSDQGNMEPRNRGEK